MNGNDYDLDFTIKKPTRKSYKDNLNGGIAKFINVNKKKDVSKDEYNKKYNKDYYKIRKNLRLIIIKLILQKESSILKKIQKKHYLKNLGL